MVLTLPPLLCAACGACTVPCIGPGAGQHVARALCSQCGHFLKWLPQRLFAKESPRMGSINRVILCGTISKYGVTVRYATTGTPCATLTLVLAEQGQDGKPHATYIDCEVWGRKAEAAGELEAGQLALFEGKLAKRKKGEQWETVVSGFELTAVLPPVPTLTGNPN